MKKFNLFLVRLKPYKRLYKIFWMCFIIGILFVFQILMISLSYAVPHKEGGFSYWFKGLYFLLFESGKEPNSAQGFLFAASVVGVIPIIFILPVLYFTFTNWFIQEKLSDKFIQIPKDKYLYWAKFFHLLIIGVTFSVIFGALSYLSKGGYKITKAIQVMGTAFSNDLSLRIGGISSILYLVIGLPFLSIVILWSIWMALVWIARKINLLIEIYRAYRMRQKELKRERKLAKLEKKAMEKQNKNE